MLYSLASLLHPTHAPSDDGRGPGSLHLCARRLLRTQRPHPTRGPRQARPGGFDRNRRGRVQAHAHAARAAPDSSAPAAPPSDRARKGLSVVSGGVDSQRHEAANAPRAKASHALPRPRQNGPRRDSGRLVDVSAALARQNPDDTWGIMFTSVLDLSESHRAGPDPPRPSRRRCAPVRPPRSSSGQARLTPRKPATPAAQIRRSHSPTTSANLPSTAAATFDASPCIWSWRCSAQNCRSRS